MKKKHIKNSIILQFIKTMMENNNMTNSSSDNTECTGITFKYIAKDMYHNTKEICRIAVQNTNDKSEICRIAVQNTNHNKNPIYLKKDLTRPYNTITNR